MKDDNYQRDVRAGSGQREVGAADIGKVGRVLADRSPNSGGAAGEKRRRGQGRRPADEKKSAANRMLLNGWSIALGCAALAIVGGVFVVWLLPQRGEGVAAPLTPLPAAADVAPLPEEPAPLVGEEALAWVEKALDERDPERIGERLRLGETPAADAIAFLEEREREVGTRRSFEWLGNMNANGLTLEGVLVNFERDGQRQNRLALLTPEGGGWKVDFAAFARLTNPSWEEFLGADGGEIVARIYASRDNYYNGPFRDEGKWICYGIASPDHPQLFFGYSKVGSPQAQALAGLLRKARGPLRLTVTLRRAEGAEDRQLEIARVLAEDWVLGPVAYDERSGR